MKAVQFFESLDRINRAIQANSDLETMMQSVLDETLEIFDCDRAFLLYPCNPDADAWSIPMERTKPEFPGAGILNTGKSGTVYLFLFEQGEFTRIHLSRWANSTITNSPGG